MIVGYFFPELITREPTNNNAITVKYELLNEDGSDTTGCEAAIPAILPALVEK